MHIYKTWPDTLEGIPTALTIAIKAHLAEAFDHDLQAVQQFWQQYPSTLIVIHSDSGIKNLNEETQTLINLALEYSEYQEALTDLHMINLAIVDDEGSGVYLVYPNNFDFSAIKEKSNGR
jgi:hypothetical protein